MYNGTMNIKLFTYAFQVAMPKNGSLDMQGECGAGRCGDCCAAGVADANFPGHIGWHCPQLASASPAPHGRQDLASAHIHIMYIV